LILVDTGPLVAMQDRSDPDHARCTSFAKTLRTPMITTWQCLTETMYFLHDSGGWAAQQRLWAKIRSGDLRVHATTESESLRMEALMRDYADAPCDLADASLVAVAESLKLRRIFTVDSHFHAYRLGDRRVLEVLPTRRASA